jgi:hypothetical protein
VPSTSQQRRGRSTTRRSPRPAPRPAVTPATLERPLAVPFAVLFGLLVAAVDGYLTWLISFGWYLVFPLVLGVAATAGAVLVWFGRRGGWVLLAVAAGLQLLGMLALAVLFAVLGGGSAMWSAVLMLVAPVGCLALVLRRPVRRWSDAGGPTRSPGGRRAGGSSR